MGALNSKPTPCPFDQFVQVKRDRAKSLPYKKGEASDFYFLCANGKTDDVRQILDAEDSPTIDVLNQLQPNGSTALHAATHYEHLEIVQLLLERNCSRTEVNRFGNTAYEEATSDEMKKLFHRSNQDNRFHETSVSNTMSLYLPEEDIEGISVERVNDYVYAFQTESEILEYSLNQQTTAMWVKFYNWFVHTFRTVIEREDIHVDTFNLINHPDFNQFLKRSLSEPNLQETMKSLNEAQRGNSIEPLITLYTSEAAGFYRPFNQLLAHSSSQAEATSHLCDRFIIEFHIRRHELKQRAFTGISYRGATMHVDHLSVYHRALKSQPSGVLGLKTFTSTSRDPLIALDFAFRDVPNDEQKHVLFIFEITEASPTIFAVNDISKYGYEQEVLILPGNLFIVTKIQEQSSPPITNIYLKYWHTPISFSEKIKQTVRAGRKSVIAT